MKYIDQYKKLLLTPKLYFEEYKEKDMLKILLFFLIPYVIVQSLSQFLEISKTFLTENIVIALSGSIMAIMVVILLGAIAPFIASAVTHIGVLMFGGKKGYKETFKATTNAMIIQIPYLLLVLIIQLGFIAALGIQGIQDLIIITIISAIITFLSTIHLIIVEVIGLKKLQELSTARAILASIIPIILILVLFVLVLLLGALFFLIFL